MASLFIPFPSAFPSAWSSPVCSPPPSCREPALSLGRGGALYQGTSCPLSPAWRGRGGGSEPCLPGLLTPFSLVPTRPCPCIRPDKRLGPGPGGTARWPRLPPALRVFPSRSLALFLPLSVRLSVSVSVSHHGNSFSFCPHPSDYKSEGKPQAWVCVRAPSWRVGGWGGRYPLQPPGGQPPLPLAGPSPQWVGRTHSKAGLPGLGA